MSPMEATGIYWKPVWHVLEGRFELVLANAQHIRNVPGRKTDVNDATWIADLLAHGLIRSSFVPPLRIQELRDLTRTRKQIVREISQHTLRIEVAKVFVEEYRKTHPGDEVDVLDLWAAPLPEFDGEVIDAKYAILHGQAHTPAQKDA